MSDDYSELVNDLREYLTTRQISDLLEAQAKEIAEKDARISSWEQDNEVLGQLLSAKVKDNEKLRARIAELAEALKPFVPKTQVIDPAIPDTRPIDVMVRAGELRAAAAAIRNGDVKGE